MKVNLRAVLFNVALVAFASAPATIRELEKQVRGLELARADPKTSDEVKKIIPPILTGKLQQLTNLLDGALKEISGFPESERSDPQRSYTAALKRVFDESIDLALDSNDAKGAKALLDKRRKLAGAPGPGVPDIEGLRKRIDWEEGMDHDARLAVAGDATEMHLEADKKIYRCLLCDERLALELVLNQSKNLSDSDKSTIRDRVKQISNELPASRASNRDRSSCPNQFTFGRSCPHCYHFHLRKH